MARVFTFPRAARGSKIYRVEWKKDTPTVAEYSVQTSATSMVVVHDAAGKEHTLTGKEALRQFGLTIEDAVAREFERIATVVSRHGGNAIQATMQAAKLGKLLE